MVQPRRQRRRQPRQQPRRQRASFGDLPPCDGPKLRVFPDHKAPIKWLGMINEGGEGYVFKVEIKSKLYALKVFKFYNADETRYFWGPFFDDDFPADKIALHTDPFLAECRAFGKIEQGQNNGTIKGTIAVPCFGYILLSDKDRVYLESEGVDLEKDCLDGNPPPIRAIVKELAPQDSGVHKKSLRKIIRDVRELNRHKIYNRDIKKDNFKGGLLVDFGTSWTEPHFILDAVDADEAKTTRVGDLTEIDLMVSEEGIKTSVKAGRNWGYCSRLRSAKRGRG